MGPKSWDPVVCLLPKVTRHLCIKEKKNNQENRKKPGKNGKPLVNGFHHCPFEKLFLPIPFQADSGPNPSYLCPAAIITAILHLPSWVNYQLKPGDIPSKGNRQALTKLGFYFLDMEIASCTKHRSTSFSDPMQFLKNSNVCFMSCSYHTSLQCVSMDALKWIFLV